MVYLIELILFIDNQWLVTKFYGHQILTTIFNIRNFHFFDNMQQNQSKCVVVITQKTIKSTFCFVQFQFIQDIFIYPSKMEGKPSQHRPQPQNHPNQTNTTHFQTKKKEPKKQQATYNQTQTNLDPHQKFQENNRPTMSQIGQDLQSYQTEYQQEDFFQGMGSYSSGDENTNPMFQIRKQHTSAYNQYPFNTIVRAISIFEARPVENPRDFQFGSGVIINPRMIFTVAHNIWEKNLNISPDYVFVQPQSQEQPKKLIRVIKIGVHKAYFNLKDTQREKYDLAILILEQNEIIKPNMTMRLKTHYDHKMQKDKDIIVAGFPKDINVKNQNRFNQFYCELKIESTDKNSNFINYINATSGGQSGAPLILKFYNSEAYPEYISIGLHKGIKGIKSYGILTTNDNMIEVAQIARKYCIMNSKNQQEIIDKNKQTLELLKEIQNLENGQSVLELNNIVWINLKKKAQSLNSLVCKNDPESFRSAILKIKQSFGRLKKSLKLKNLVSETVQQSLFDNQKIMKSVFGIKEQEDYFTIIEIYIDYFFDIKKDIKQIQFYKKLGERLYNLQNQLSFKKDVIEVNKDRELTLSRMQHKFIERRERIIQNINKRLSIPPSKQSYQKQQKILIELNFLLKLNDFNKSQKYIDCLQRQDQNDRILLLKAELLYLNGNVKRSKIFFEKVRDSNGGQGKESFQYTQAITKLGEIHRTRGEYVKCFEYFNQNMQIRKRMNPQEDTIEYAEALNHLATYEMDNIDKNRPNNTLDQTVKKIKTALDIAEKSYGPNSIELVKYLTNLSMVYYSKSQTSESLKHSKKALQIIKNVKGVNSLETIEILNNIGAAFKNSKNNKKDALEYYQKALEIEQMHRGEQSYYCAPILNNIAHLHLNLGNLAECETNLKRCIKIYEKFKTDYDATNKIGCGLAYFNLACFYKMEGRHKQAAQQAQKSYKILKESDGSNHKGAQNAYDLWQFCKNKAK